MPQCHAKIYQHINESSWNIINKLNKKDRQMQNQTFVQITNFNTARICIL